MNARNWGRPQVRPAVFVAGAAIAALAAGCSSATNELNPTRERLALGDRPGLGQVLTDGDGRTVYLFEKDEAHESYCSGACASVWPPVTTRGMPTVDAGLDASKVTLIKRDDSGLMQVVYDGHPLYYYQADTSDDDAYGQSKDQFGAEWYTVGAAGMTSEAHPTDGSGGTSNSGGGSGGSYG